MRKLIALLVASLMIVSVAASASALTIGFSQIGQESDWRTANTDNILAGAEAAGITLIYDDAQQKQENQVKALRNFISQNVDYIFFTGVVTTGWAEVLKEVTEAEIPLFLLDRIPTCVVEGSDDYDPSIEYVYAFGGDFVEEGRRMAYWTENYYQSIGKGEEEINVVILEGTTGSDAAIGRTNGINEVLAQYPHLKIVASQTGNFTRSEGQQVMESLLKSVDKIDVVLAQNDDMGLGAIDAIKAAGLVPGQDVIIVGCDSVKAAFDSIVAGEMSATIECTPLYWDAVYEAVQALEAGGEASKTIVHPAEDVFDYIGGIPSNADGSLLSIKAEDVIAERLY